MDIAGVGPDTPTTSNEKGGKQSNVPYRFDLVDAQAMFAMCEILHTGAEKYGVDNWRDIPVHHHLNHLIMHAYAWLAGDSSDDHLAHALCRAMFAVVAPSGEMGEVCALFKQKAGDPPWPCYFCGKPVDGIVRYKSVVHHVDHNHDNNVIENLAPAHKGCHDVHHLTGRNITWGDKISKSKKEEWASGVYDEIRHKAPVASSLGNHKDKNK